jgi:hypothetical protein
VILEGENERNKGNGQVRRVYERLYMNLCIL